MCNDLRLNSILDEHNHFSELVFSSQNFLHTKQDLLNSLGSFVTAADETVAAVSPYTKVDKTGFIGFFADLIEKGIDFGHFALNQAGIQYTYGFSIILFTLLSK